MSTPEKSMTIFEHLNELRNRILIGIGAVTIGMIISWIFIRPIIELLKYPLPAEHRILQALQPTEVFWSYFCVAIIAGLILGLPVLIWQLWLFIRPGLTSTEIRAVIPLLPWLVICFSLGAVFCYFIMLPTAINFFLGFGTDFAEAHWRIGDYLTFVAGLTFASGILFELPVVLVVLARLELITSNWLIQYWRHAIIIVLVIAAIITPTPDAITMLVLSAPILGLYFVSIILVKLIENKRQRLS